GGGVAVAHELGGDAQRGGALAAERDRWRLRQADDLRGVPDLEAEATDIEPGHLALDGVAISDQDDGGAELLHRRRRALDDHRGAVVAPHGVDRDLQLATFGRDDLATLVVPAVRAHAVRQLGLAALRADGTRGVGKLVVRAALAPTGLGVASLRQRHGSLLERLVPQAGGQVAQRRQTGVGRALGARALHDVAIAAARRAQTAAVLTTERLHRQGERGFRLHHAVEVELVVYVEVHVEIVGAELDAVPAGGTRLQGDVDRCVDRRGERLETAA